MFFEMDRTGLNKGVCLCLLRSDCFCSCVKWLGNLDLNGVWLLPIHMVGLFAS